MSLDEMKEGRGQFPGGVPPKPIPQEPIRDVRPEPERPIGIDPLPEVGDICLYHLRRSEMRRGRGVCAALVTWRDEEKRELELALIFEATDVLQQDRVREWPGGGERGWEVKRTVALDQTKVLGEITVLREDVAALRATVLGEFDEPEASILEMLDDVDKRVDALHRQVVVVKGKPERAPLAKSAKKASSKRK